MSQPVSHQESAAEKVVHAVGQSAAGKDRPMEKIDGSSPFVTVFFPYLLTLAVGALIVAALFYWFFQ